MKNHRQRVKTTLSPRWGLLLCHFSYTAYARGPDSFAASQLGLASQARVLNERFYILGFTNFHYHAVDLG